MVTGKNNFSDVISAILKGAELFSNKDKYIPSERFPSAVFLSLLWAKGGEFESPCTVYSILVQTSEVSLLLWNMEPCGFCGSVPLFCEIQILPITYFTFWTPSIFTEFFKSFVMENIIQIPMSYSILFSQYGFGDSTQTYDFFNLLAH